MSDHVVSCAAAHRLGLDRLPATVHPHQAELCSVADLEPGDQVHLPEHRRGVLTVSAPARMLNRDWLERGQQQPAGDWWELDYLTRPDGVVVYSVMVPAEEDGAPPAVQRILERPAALCLRPAAAVVPGDRIESGGGAPLEVVAEVAHLEDQVRATMASGAWASWAPDARVPTGAVCRRCRDGIPNLEGAAWPDALHPTHGEGACRVVTP